MIEKRKVALLLACMLASASLLSVRRWRGRFPGLQSAAVPDLEHSARVPQSRPVKADRIDNASEQETTAGSGVPRTGNTVAPRLKDRPTNSNPSSQHQPSANLPMPAQAGIKGSKNTATSVIAFQKDSRTDNHPATTPDVERYVIRSEFLFPQPRAVKPVPEITRAEWMKDLQSTLSGFSSHQVTMVTSNQAYRDVLLNWLVSATVNAKIPPETILIIAMDRPVHSLLKEKGMQSVLVTPAALLTPAVAGRGVFNQVMMTRLSVIRLLNHWGYDVTNYDTDAILLRDPRPVFESHSESDIIGTFGKFPTLLYKEWRAALCTAVLVVRSSAKTEQYWEATSRAHPASYSDQERMNYGLRALNVRWELANPASSVIRGECDNGLKIALLPYSFACRSNCRYSERESYYVWHKGGARDRASKRRNAEVGRVWLLKGEGLAAGCREEVGEAWLRCLAGMA